MEQVVIKIHPDDNVLVALKDIAAGKTVVYEGEEFTVIEDVPAKHKFFMQDMPAGSEIKMYGVLVGKTQIPVQRGARMTTTNVQHAAKGYAWRDHHYQWQKPDVSKFKDRTFNGYHRSDGRVGTADYWVFIPLVFCENRNMDVIREALQNELGYAVTEKYKSKTRQLVELYKQGEDVMHADLTTTNDTHQSQRLFPNVDGIKFLNH